MVCLNLWYLNTIGFLNFINLDSPGTDSPSNSIIVGRTILSPGTEDIMKSSLMPLLAVDWLLVFAFLDTSYMPLLLDLLWGVYLLQNWAKLIFSNSFGRRIYLSLKEGASMKKLSSLFSRFISLDLSVFFTCSFVNFRRNLLLLKPVLTNIVPILESAKCKEGNNL